MYAHEAGTHKLRVLRLDGLSDIEAHWVRSMHHEQRTTVARALAELDVVRGEFQAKMLRLLYNPDMARSLIDDVLQISDTDRNLGTAALLVTDKLMEVEGASNLVDECLRLAGIRFASCKVYGPSPRDLTGRDLIAALRNLKPCSNPEAQLLDKPLVYCSSPAERPYNLIHTDEHILYIERNEEGDIALLKCSLSSGEISGNEFGQHVFHERGDEMFPNGGLLLMQCARMLKYVDSVQTGMVALLLTIAMDPHNTWIHVGTASEPVQQLSRLYGKINHGSALSVFGHFRECENLMRNLVKSYYRKLSSFTGSPKFFMTLQEQRKHRGAVADKYEEQLSSKWSEVNVETSVEGEEMLPILIGGTGAIAKAEALLLAAGSQAVRIAAAQYKKVSISRLATHDSRKSMSGSLWLDRIVKGELMTRARVSAQLTGSIREDRPRIYETLNDEGIYMPMYQTMLVYPKMDRYLRCTYETKQIGVTRTYAELGGALVCLSLLLDDVDDPVIALELLALDAHGSEGLTKPCEGRLAELIYGASKSQEEKGKISISQLYELVYRQSSDALDKDWIVREMVSILASLNVCHTYASRGLACYSVVLERKYRRERQRIALLVYDRGIQMAGTPCRKVRGVGDEGQQIGEQLYLLERLSEEHIVLRCSKMAIMVIRNSKNRYHDRLGILNDVKPRKADIAPGHIEIIHMEKGMTIDNTHMLCYWVNAATMGDLLDAGF
ncbi:hypothetical protein FGB62_40g09 [Gracilaria domingensis]|nr:hypothetical protein FGB62_40g09 [Gracilaria domingensis]